MFAVDTIPSDSALRQTLDAVPHRRFSPAFSMLLQRLQRGKQLDAYKLESGHHLIALDGSQYFSSKNIHCPNCLTYRAQKESVRYSHQILQAVMLNPHLRQVLPLAPEPVANTDGNTKQDCEINAAKRTRKKSVLIIRSSS
jgi:hypothetical protein